MVAPSIPTGQYNRRLAPRGQQASTRSLKVGCAVVCRWYWVGASVESVCCRDRQQHSAEDNVPQEVDASQEKYNEDVVYPWDVECEDGEWPQRLLEHDRQHAEPEHMPVGARLSVEYG